MTGLRWFVSGLICVIIGWFSQGNSQTRAPGNLQILQQLLIAPLVQTVQYSVPPRESLSVSLSGERNLSQWVENTTIPLLLAKKFRVYKNTNDSVNYRIVVTGLTARILYQPLARDWLTRVVQWQRAITVSGKVEVVTSRGEIKGIFPLNGTYKDTLTVNPRTLEQTEFPFTKGDIQDVTRWKKWVEPILISAATITVVALFFTIRSQQR